MKGFYDKLQTIMQTAYGGVSSPRNQIVGATNDALTMGADRGVQNNSQAKGGANIGNSLRSDSVASLFGQICLRTLPCHPCSFG